MKVIMAIMIAVLALYGCASNASKDLEPTITFSPQERTVADSVVANMVQIPAGTFRMGGLGEDPEDDELPVRDVKIDAFAISAYEISFEQYDVFARSTGRELPEDQGWGRGARPVINVSYEDAVAFVEWLKAGTGKSFRLPSEAEWEYVARAGSEADFFHGNDIAQLCDYGNTADKSATTGWRNMTCADGFANTAPVGSFKPNAMGVYDMNGNVWEWVADCWYRNYKDAPTDSSPREKERCTMRGQRGGSWFYGSDEAKSSYRSNGNEKDKSVTLGFRVAMDL